MARNGSRSAALKLGTALLVGMLFAAPAMAQQAAMPVPTPVNQWGVTDFSGMWAGGVGGAGPTGMAQGPNFGGRGGDFFGFEEDNGLRRMAEANKPIYRPEFWQTIRDNDYWGNWRDPILFCLPSGVPRQGAPVAIYQTEREVVLIYGWSGMNGSNNAVRIVPIDGRPHNMAAAAQETWSGTPIGKIEGNKLTIETIGFTDQSWLHKTGYVHGFGMRVVETIVRTGNTFRWEATVYDEEYLQKPWIAGAQNRNLNANANNQLLAEALPCLPSDINIITSHTRSG